MTNYLLQSGVLNVNIVEAKGLENKDIAILGKSDPYATVEIRADSETQNFKTEVRCDRLSCVLRGQGR